MYKIIYKSEYGPVSIMDENGVTKSLIPGQFELANELLSGEELQQIKDLWTYEVVAAWQEKQVKQKALLEDVQTEIA